jgi:RNA polymerase-binding transcription factor
MDHDTARARLNEEKLQLQALLANTDEAGEEERESSGEPGDWTDPQVALTGEAEDDAVAEGLRLRLASVDRALARLDNGTYGRSVLSGAEIPEARLEADPAAEVTAEEALENY